MQHRIIISGGEPEADILFVGAEGKMEMERVPAAGYRIIGLPVAGLQRSLSASNLALPAKVLRSLRKAGEIIRPPCCGKPHPKASPP